MTFQSFIWSKFTTYFAINDNYKDSTGKGLFQRYLSIFGIELDAEIIPGIENFLENIDPATAADQLLTNISYALGSPDDITSDTNNYRNLLTQIISIYQIKGTFRSYQALFALFGLTVTIHEKFLGTNSYDMSPVYDTVNIFDDDPCSHTCIHYELTYSNQLGITTGALSNDMLIKLTALITNLLQPHSAELDNIFYVAPTLPNSIFPYSFPFTLS